MITSDRVIVLGDEIVCMHAAVLKAFWFEKLRFINVCLLVVSKRIEGLDWVDAQLNVTLYYIVIQ